MHDVTIYEIMELAMNGSSYRGISIWCDRYTAGISVSFSRINEVNSDMFDFPVKSIEVDASNPGYLGICVYDDDYEEIWTYT